MVLDILVLLVTIVLLAVLSTQVSLRRRGCLVSQVILISIVGHGKLTISVGLSNLFSLVIIVCLVIVVKLASLGILVCPGALPLASLGSLVILIRVTILVSIICLGLGLLAA